jgi:hypothetical protein
MVSTTLHRHHLKSVALHNFHKVQAYINPHNTHTHTFTHYFYAINLEGFNIASPPIISNT